jgi:imidazolonepropionase-like amidohydrolase
LAAPLSAQQPGPSLVALTNMTVIDGTGAAPMPQMTLIIEDGLIVALHPSDDREPPSGAQVHDLTGKTVVPGLVESHFHLGQLRSRARRRAELERMFYGGVLVAREMAGDMRIVAEASRSALLGEAASPDIYYAAVMAGPYFASMDPRMVRAAAGHPPGGVPWAQAVTPETDLRLAVARAAGTGATGVKLYAQLDAELIEVLTEEAHRQGLEVWAHATVYPDRPVQVVRAGVDVVSHACGLGWQDADVDPGLHRRFDITSRPGFDADAVESDSPEMGVLFEEMVRRGTILEPTLANHARPGDDPFGCTLDLVVALTRAAHAAGVPLVTGTDFYADESDPYPSLHREIEALVHHGVLTPLEAIVAATRNGAHAIGIEDSHGTIEPGKVANLVVLDRNPARDVRALRSVTMLIKRGRVYPRAEYDSARQGR